MTYLIPKCRVCKRDRWVDTLACECGSYNVIYPHDKDY